MSWRTIMGAGKATGEKNRVPTKTSTESTKPTRQVLERPNSESFVDIVEVFRGSQNTSEAFALNAGSNPKAPSVRHTPYRQGQVVNITSRMFGPFQAEVLRDNGTIVWVWHPFLEREAAIPNEWLIEKGGME